MSLKFEQLAAQYSSAHIILSGDVSLTANTGAIIIKNSAWSKIFIMKWISNKAVYDTEQLGLEDLLRASSSTIVANGRAFFDGKLLVLSPEIINSVAPPMLKQEPNHQVTII